MSWLPAEAVCTVLRSGQEVAREVTVGWKMPVKTPLLESKGFCHLPFKNEQMRLDSPPQWPWDFLGIKKNDSGESEPEAETKRLSRRFVAQALQFDC